MALFLLIAVALGLVGVVVKGLIYLLIIGIVVFVVDLVFVGYLRGRSPAPGALSGPARADERQEVGRVPG